MLRFLIVDDSPTMRKMIMAALKPLKGTFGEAGSGLEAIEQLAIAPYDAVTLDLNMPDMHGLEVLAFVRSHDSYKRLPVIVISTRSDAEVRQQLLSAGASAYVSKPFTPKDLIEQIRPLLPAEAR